MRILYISRSKLGHSVNAVYIKGLRANNVDVRELFIGGNEFFNLIRYLFKHKKSFDAVLVGYDSPFLVCVAKLFSGKKVIYNALCSVYERMIISRALAGPVSLKTAYYWLSDFLAVHSADLVMVETNEQAKYFKKLFRVSNKKLFRAWTGARDDLFYNHGLGTEKFPVFTAVFRGQFLPESGVETLIRASKLLDGENIKILLLGGGLGTSKAHNLINEFRPDNLEFVNKFLSNEELQSIMQKSHLCLGQLAKHPRLERTVPHKAYESLAMRLPYLTASNRGILELLKSGDNCITCEPASPESLAEKIIWAKNNPEELERVAENGFQFYCKNLKSEILAKKLLERMVA